MPDVKIWITPEDVEVPTLINTDIRQIVAEHMSCWVPKQDGQGYEFYKLNEGEIDITVFDEIVASDDTYIIIEVAAYDFPDRMHNITERIEQIALLIKRCFGLPQGAPVSVTFIPIRQGHWVTV